MSNDEDASAYRPRRAAGPVDEPAGPEQERGVEPTPPGRRAAGFAANDSDTDAGATDSGAPRRGRGFASDGSMDETSINPVVTDAGPGPAMAPPPPQAAQQTQPQAPQQTQPQAPQQTPPQAPQQTPPQTPTPESGRPTAPRALSVRAEPVVDAPVPPRREENEAERPVNPFAPKPEPEQQAPEEPQGRRVAEPEQKERNPFKRLRAKREESRSSQGPQTPVDVENEDTESTKVLPAGAAARGASADADPTTAEKPKKKRSKRNMVAVGVSIAAGIIIVALVASFGVWTLGKSAQTANQSPSSATNSEPGPPLTQEMLLSQAQAKTVDSTRDWSVTGTDTGITDKSASAPCVAPQPSGQPGPQITYLRTLTASGDDKSALLHRADTFATVEDAQKVFNFRSAEIGACTGTPYYIESGLGFHDLGDQAVGVRLMLREQTPQYHTIIIVRTGRTVNIFDAHRLKEPMNRPQLTNAIGEVVNSQCGSVGGLCAGSALASAETVPPPAGDAPGFMVPNDLPRLSDGVGSWNATPVTKDLNIRSGTGCEGVDLGTVSGTTDKGQRTYLLRDDPAAPTGFGADEVLLTFGSNGDATGLSDRISQGLSRCQQSTLTGQATTPAPFETQVSGVTVKGFTSTVTQKLEGGQQARYRVAVVVADKKLVYLLNNADKLDFTDQAWNATATRAGQRATQSR
ncbi:hypothetical protein [Granulicoccus phenolivorans]|uniref:hypothetical protein n=1 Tax=Granulicoccus phenolivorans TaxID=266854 RepID=UPI0003FDA537|nr:hypothetical protein [Granulicoccus phenolivorans]